jgi:hypothetical protein
MTIEEITATAKNYNKVQNEDALWPYLAGFANCEGKLLISNVHLNN